MPSIKDIYDLIRDHDYIAFAMMFFICGAGYTLYLLRKYLKAMNASLDVLKKSFLDQDGNIVNHALCSARSQRVLDEMADIIVRFDKAFMDLVHSTAQIADEEHWKSCPVDRCPYLIAFGHRQQQMLDIVRQYKEEFLVATEQNRREIQLVHRRFDEISAEQLAVLRQWIKERRAE